MDWIHWASILICVAQFGYILAYYIPPLQKYGESGPDFEGDKYISDFLFSSLVYRAAMTFFVALQLGVCALYVVRLRDHGDKWTCCFCPGVPMQRFFFFSELVLFAVAWAGWSTLCAEYSGVEGVSNVHFIGVGFFIGCSAMYVLLMLFHVWSVRASWSRFAWVEFFAAVFFFVASLGLAIDFIVRVFHDKKHAWLTEHPAFLFFVLSHMMLFIVDSNSERAANEVVDSPDETRRLLSPSGPVAGTMFSAVRITHMSSSSL
jgi:uncharacterized membrane protein YhaH (DUF805 family)